MPPKAVQKTKEQKLAAALAGSRKSKKKKWAKGRVKEKKNNKVILYQDEFSSVMKEIPRMKCITISLVSEKFQITGSLAKKLIHRLANQGSLDKVYDSAGFLLYKKSAKQIELEKERQAKAEQEAKKKGKKGRKQQKGKTKR